MKSTAMWIYALVAVLIVASVIILIFFIFREGFIEDAISIIRTPIEDFISP